jgi:hypothetical protein
LGDWRLDVDIGFNEIQDVFQPCKHPSLPATSGYCNLLCFRHCQFCRATPCKAMGFHSSICQHSCRNSLYVHFGSAFLVEIHKIRSMDFNSRHGCQPVDTHFDCVFTWTEWHNEIEVPFKGKELKSTNQFLLYRSLTLRLGVGQWKI